MRQTWSRTAASPQTYEAAITSGFVAPGDRLPTMKSLAERYGVALSTAHRAVSVLVEAGLVNASRGVRATVAGGDPINGQANNGVVG
jgi:DNA-binding GntR family transcriptional regulator